ncbi:hypothetical protein M514_10589 [Trichuris suis]|uniref:J domain-containing protein n=1 Tax=Trichuris suis TaxID=68888 RepID=A0A085MSZ3_9BILA|nr:hypothetical protein M514_10589 [Trichuris suis]
MNHNKMVKLLFSRGIHSSQVGNESDEFRASVYSEEISSDTLKQLSPLNVHATLPNSIVITREVRFSDLFVVNVRDSFAAVECQKGKFCRKDFYALIRATSLYEVLGVKQDASKEEIKTAFYGLSKQYHPDMVKKGSPSHLKYVQIVEAYNVLSRAESRQKYDKTAPQRSSITFSRSDMETRQPATMHGQYSYYYAWNNGGGFHKNPFINECTIPLTEDDLRRRRWIITLFFLISLLVPYSIIESHRRKLESNIQR